MVQSYTKEIQNKQPSTPGFMTGVGKTFDNIGNVKYFEIIGVCFLSDTDFLK